MSLIAEKQISSAIEEGQNSDLQEYGKKLRNAETGYSIANLLIACVHRDAALVNTPTLCYPSVHTHRCMQPECF